MKTLAQFSGTVRPDTPEDYINYHFELPANVGRLIVKLEYQKPGICQLYLSVFAPDGYRGSRMLPAAIGAVCLVLDLSADSASLGGLPGPLTPGTWRAQLDLERTAFVTDYRLSIEIDDQAAPASSRPSKALFEPRREPGWYRGELHSHSHHSDGRTSVAELVASARHHKLDFLSLTDHFTNAGWQELEALSGPDLCLMRGLEITGHRGHANLHQLQDWVNPFVDTPERWSINDAARAAHAQGALVGVNHPFSLDLGWRYHEFDWDQCDLLEIYHHHEGEDNARQLALFDELLRAGRHITGVAGTDSHDPFRGRNRLGQVVTVVQASALEPSAILKGLKRGAAYVSFGPSLNFTASAGDSSAGMGQTLYATDSVQLEVQLWDVPHPSRLVLLKNGWYHRHVDLEAGSQHTVRFSDAEVMNGYYRFELYAQTRQTELGSGREWRQTLCLSNPIYIELRQ